MIAQSSNRIVASARNPASLSTVPDGPNVLKLGLDVTSIGSIDMALKEAVAEFGRIDIVVNNAGYTLVGDTEAAEEDEASAILDTNFWGTVNVTKRVLGIMRETNANSGGQQGGVVLNVSSMGGFIGFPGSSFYHASKFAVEGWTEAVAKELPTSWNSKYANNIISTKLTHYSLSVHLSNIEPGGVKTNYATTSLKMMARGRHPAYADPTFPTNALLGYMMQEESRSTWAEPDAIAAALYRVVSRGQRIPIRVPLGADAFGMILSDLQDIQKDLDEVKDISLSVSDAKQLESISFLRKG